MVRCLELVKQNFFANCPYRIKEKNDGLEFYKYFIKNNDLFIANKLIAKFNNEQEIVLAIACDFFSFRCKNRIQFLNNNEVDVKFYIQNVFLYFFPDQTQFVKENENQIKIGEIIMEKNAKNIQQMIYEVCCYKFQQRVAAYLTMFC